MSSDYLRNKDHENDGFCLGGNLVFVLSITLTFFVVGLGACSSTISMRDDSGTATTSDGLFPEGGPNVPPSTDALGAYLAQMAYPAWWLGLEAPPAGQSTPSYSAPTGGSAPCACGDIAGPDGLINVADISYLVDYLFLQGSPPPFTECADVDLTGVVNVVDLTYLVTYVYKNGPAPCAGPPPTPTPAPSPIPSTSGCVARNAHVVPNFVRFEKQVRNNTSSRHTIVIENGGDEPITLLNAATANPFSIIGFSGPVVLQPANETSPADTLNIDVEFTPPSAGSFLGEIVLTFQNELTIEKSTTKIVKLWGAGITQEPMIEVQELSLPSPKELNVEGATYILQNNIVCDGTCFDIQEQNITLDFNGKEITYGTNPAITSVTQGIYCSGCNGVTITSRSGAKGKITQGAGAAEQSHAIELPRDGGSNYVDISELEISIHKKSSMAIDSVENYGEHIHHNIIHNNVTRVENRHALYAFGLSIHVGGNSSFRSSIHDNHIIGGPQGGILVDGIDSQIYRNTISQNSHYSNDFAIYFWDPNGELFQNTIYAVPRSIWEDPDPGLPGAAPDASGRGIQVATGEDYADRVIIRDNHIDVINRAQHDEYFGCSPGDFSCCQSGGTYGIQLEELATNAYVYGNTVKAYAEECVGMAFRYTGVPSATVCKNEFKAIRVAGSSEMSAAVSSKAHDVVPITFYDNDFISDRAIIDFQDSAAGGQLRFGQKNRFYRGGQASSDYVTFNFFSQYFLARVELLDPEFFNGAGYDAANVNMGQIFNAYTSSELKVNWSFEVTVTNQQTGQPIDGATVTMVGKNGSGASISEDTVDGKAILVVPEIRRYNSSGSPSLWEDFNDYELTVTAPGFLSYTHPSLVKIDQATKLSISLNP